MKVWLLADVLLARATGKAARLLFAGTCLFIAEDQTLAPRGMLAVHGADCFDIIPIEWLTFNPNN